MRTRAIHHDLRRILAAVTLLCPIVVGVGATSAGASSDGFGGEVILSVPFTDSDVSAFSTIEPSETVPSCGPLRTTEWYQFTTPFSNTMTATLTGNFDLLLAVYTDPNGTGPAGLNEVACENPFAEELTLSSIPVTAGETYYFQISSEDAFAGGGGNFTFALDYDGPVPPDNDDFDDAQIIFESDPPTTGTNALATVEPGEVTSACANSGDPVQSSVWYRLPVNDDIPLLITTAGSDFDTELSIFSGSSLASLEEVACDDDNNGGFQAARVFHPNPGGAYFVRVDGFGGGTGNITFDMAELACGAPEAPRV